MTRRPRSLSPLLYPLLATACLLAAAAPAHAQAPAEHRLVIHEGPDGAYPTLEGGATAWPTVPATRNATLRLVVTNNGTSAHEFSVHGQPEPMACGIGVDETLAFNATTGPIAPGATGTVELTYPVQSHVSVLYRVDGSDRVGNVVDARLATQCATVSPLPGPGAALTTGALGVVAVLLVAARRRGAP